MTRATCLVAFGLVLVGLAGCQPVERDAPHQVLTGSREMVPLVKEIGKRFEEEHPGVRIDVQSRNADLGIADVRQGLADIGLAARALRADETSLSAVAIAYDGIALVVHASNPVPALTDEQITGLFTRVFTNWASVGGPERPVMLVAQNDGQALRDVFAERFLLKTSVVRPDHIVATTAQAVQAVAGSPAAIGYVSLGVAQKAAVGLQVRFLPLGGVPATLDNVARGTYPLRRPLNLVTRQPAAGLVAELIEFARSPQMREVVRKHGFVPLGLEGSQGR